MKASLKMSSSKPVCSLGAVIRWLTVSVYLKTAFYDVTYEGKNLEINRLRDLGDGWLKAATWF